MTLQIFRNLRRKIWETKANLTKHRNKYLYLDVKLCALKFQMNKLLVDHPHLKKRTKVNK